MNYNKIISDEKINKIIENHINDFLFARYSETSDNDQMVDEALIYSYDARFVHRKLCAIFNLAPQTRDFDRNHSKYNGLVIIRKSKNNCSVILLALPNSKSHLLKDITLKMEKAYGWFLARPIEVKINGCEGWQFEKKMMLLLNLKLINICIIFAQLLVCKRYYMWDYCLRKQLGSHIC